MEKILTAIRSSLVAKVFIVSFLAIHLPLIALVVYLGFGRPSEPLPILIVALLATLLGAVLSYLAIHQLVNPIDRLVSAMDRYQQEGIEPIIEVRGTDGVRRLADKVLSLVRAQEKSLSILKRQANSDPLTGLGNRRWLQNAVSVEINRAVRRDQWVWVIAFDLDHFKDINDRFGHAAGDEVLMIVAEVAQRQLRPYDLVARIGGEEFCVVCADDSLDFGLVVAERLRAAIESWRSNLNGETTIITASFGVHRGDPATQTFAEMLRQADKHLYAAKAQGRNKVIGADADAPLPIRPTQP